MAPSLNWKSITKGDLVVASGGISGRESRALAAIDSVRSGIEAALSAGADPSSVHPDDFSILEAARRSLDEEDSEIQLPLDGEVHEPFSNIFLFQERRRKNNSK